MAIYLLPPPPLSIMYSFPSVIYAFRLTSLRTQKDAIRKIEVGFGAKNLMIKVRCSDPSLQRMVSPLLGEGDSFILFCLKCFFFLIFFILILDKASFSSFQCKVSVSFLFFCPMHVMSKKKNGLFNFYMKRLFLLEIKVKN